MVYRPERLPEAFSCLGESGLQPKRIRFVHHNITSKPSVALIESRRNAKPSLQIMPPLIIKNQDGSDTDEIKRIYHI